MVDPQKPQSTPTSVSKLLTQYVEGQRDFRGTILNQANLYRAQLSFVNLDEASLRKAELRFTNFTGASLNHANLSSANLSNAVFIGADLIRANLTSANLARSVMSGANLSGANLRKADLTDTSLAGANLSSVDFSGAILDNTNLEGANLAGANFSNTTLEKVNLQGLDLSNAILSELQILQLQRLQSNYPNLLDPQYSTPFGYFPELSHQNEPDPFEIDEENSDFFQTEEQANHSEGYGATPAEDFAAFDPNFTPSEGTAAFDADDPFSHPLSFDSPNSTALTVPPGFSDAEVPMSDFSNELAENLDSSYLADPQEAPDFSVSEPNAAENSAFSDPEVETSPPLFDEVPGTQFHQISEGDRGEHARFFTEPPEELAPPDPPTEHSESPDLSVIPLPTPENHSIQSRPNQSLQSLSQNLNSKAVQSLQSVLQRRVQYNFKKSLLEAYNHQCAITGCTLRPLLEVTFITPKNEVDLDHPSNGLVLRVDIEHLYRLHLIAIDPTELTVLIAPSLQDSEYGYLQGKQVFLPTDIAKRPNPKFLSQHLQTCKWYVPPERPVSPTPTTVKPTRTQQRPLAFPELSRSLPQTKWLNPKTMGIGGAAVCLLLGTILWTQSATRPKPQPAAPQPSSEIVMLQDRGTGFDIKLASLSYPGQGMIVSNSAYVPLSLLDALGIESSQIPTSQQVQYQGDRYLKAVELKKLGVQLDWNSSSRTMSLKSPKKLEIQPFKLTINQEDYPESGVIIQSSAYVPLDTLTHLNLEPSQISAVTRLQYKDQVYFKASQLKALKVLLDWDSQARIMSLKKS